MDLTQSVISRHVSVQLNNIKSLYLYNFRNDACSRKFFFQHIFVSNVKLFLFRQFQLARLENSKKSQKLSKYASKFITHKYHLHPEPPFSLQCISVIDRNK